jgi:hypothetical protein
MMPGDSVECCYLTKSPGNIYIFMTKKIVILALPLGELARRQA